MINTIAWLLFVLGIGHIVFGLIRFRVPLAEACRDGFVGKFETSEARRAAFWFMIFGPLLIGIGHAAIHAVSSGDLALLRIIGAYALFTSLAGVTAFPKSPFVVAMVLSLLLVAGGYGWL